MTTHPSLRTTVRLIPALTAAVLAATVANAIPAQASAPHRSTLPIHLEHGVVAAPARTHPGMTHIRNTGRDPILLIAEKRLGTRALVRELNDNSDTAPSRLSRDFTVLDYVGGHADAYLRLARGTLFLAPADSRHFSQRSITTTTVSGQARNAQVPASSRIAVNPGGLSAPARVPAHRYLHLIDNTHQLQELLVLRPGSGVSDDTIRHYVANPTYTGFTALKLRSIQVAGFVTHNHSVYVDAPNKSGRLILMTISFQSSRPHSTLRAATVRF